MMRMSSSIVISVDAAEVLVGEAQALRALVKDKERRSRLADLIAGVSEGEVRTEDVDALAEMLELGLETGRIRALYGPGGEQAALRVYRKLPRGRELAASAGEVTDALGALVGRPLEQLAIAAPAPGTFVVTIAVEGRQLTLRLDGQGARIVSVGS